MRQLSEGSLHRFADWDTLTRDYIRARLAFRWVSSPSAADALGLERRIRAGASAAGKPFLNPL
jgi:hypothetical protein